MDPALAAVVAAHFDLPIASATPVVGLGDECEIWRTAGPGGFAVRVSPVWRSAADLEWVYGVAAVFAARVPGVQAPLRAVDGRSVVTWDGRPVSVWSWVAGAPLDRDSARARDQAAVLLARLHECAEELRVEGSRPRPVPRCERCDHWPDLRDPELDEMLDRWESDRSGRVPVHGDYYRRNLIWHGGAIAGLLDWDELRIDFPERELAWATWEFAKDRAGGDLVWRRAGRFLDVYEARRGRWVDRRWVVPLIREGLRVEVCRSRMARGGADDAYAASEVRAFRGLRGRDVGA
jgi:Ser/Thr protein kinase RdoA (MazF antagonist)